MSPLSCSSSGQWEEAVHVYNSTPLQELSDLVGLALAYCRAGLITESINGEECNIQWNKRIYIFTLEWPWNDCVCTLAYERALAVASCEKEKAYILTALALLQHQQGNLDSAKTLLFKWWVHSVVWTVKVEFIPVLILCVFYFLQANMMMNI